MNEFEQREAELEEDFASGGATVGMHRFWRIMKIIFFVFVYAVIAALLLRMCSNGTPKDMERITVNDELYEAYQNEGKDLLLQYQKYDEYTTEDENYGYFGVVQAVIIPSVDQVQIVFRYNNSTLDYLPLDYPELCPESPSRDEVLYDVSLVKVIDLTPENAEDNEKDEFLKYERYFPTDSLTSSKQSSLHNYFRYVFEDVSLDDALYVYVDIYYNKAIDYESDAYGSIRIFDASRYTHTYAMTSNDRRAFKNYKK